MQHCNSSRATANLARRNFGKQAPSRTHSLTASASSHLFSIETKFLFFDANGNVRGFFCSAFPSCEKTLSSVSSVPSCEAQLQSPAETNQNSNERTQLQIVWEKKHSIAKGAEDAASQIAGAHVQTPYTRMVMKRASINHAQREPQSGVRRQSPLTRRNTRFPTLG